MYQTLIENLLSELSLESRSIFVLIFRLLRWRLFFVQLIIHAQAELNQMHVENERLRDMINQVNNNYNVLKTNLDTLIQHRQIRNVNTEKHDHEVVLLRTILLRNWKPISFYLYLF